MLVRCASPNCNNIFEQRHYKHIFCSRKCFIVNWRKSLKSSKYPIFKCPECGKVTQLDFHPISSKQKWLVFKCDECGYQPMGGLLERILIIM